MESQATNRADWIALGQLSERTLVSILRTAIYAGVAGAFALVHGGAKYLLDAIILGAVLADFITWLARSFMQLPETLAHGGYDAALNRAFSWSFFHFGRFEMADDGTSLMGAFVAFMLVRGAKVCYYSVQSVARMSSG